MELVFSTWICLLRFVYWELSSWICLIGLALEIIVYCIMKIPTVAVSSMQGFLSNGSIGWDR